MKNAGKNSCSQPNNAFNVSPIPGTVQMSPFFLVFGRNAPSPEMVTLDLPVETIPRSIYSGYISLSLVCRKHKSGLLTNNKADVKRTPREYYDKSSRELHIPEGKQVCVRRPPPRSRPKGSATRLIRRFDGPCIETGDVHGRQDLLLLRHKFTEDELKTVNIKKIVVLPDELSDDLTNYEDQPHNVEIVSRSELLTQMNSVSDLDLAKLAFWFWTISKWSTRWSCICIRGLQSCVTASSRCSGPFETLWKAKRIGTKVPLHT